MEISAQALRNHSPSRRCQNDWSGLPVALVLSLVLSMLAGCRSPRMITLKAMHAPIALLRLAPTTPAAPSTAQPGPLEMAGPSGAQATASPGLNNRTPLTATDSADSEDSLSLVTHLEPPAKAEPATSEDLVEVITDEAEEILPRPIGAEPGPGSGSGPDASSQTESRDRSNVIDLRDVLISATESYPAIREASLLRTIAIGNHIAALGEFDDRLEAFTINQPLGFYENYRHGVGWKKPRLLGGTTYAGYRIGDGEFEPWYGERETDEGGEFKAGFDIPLLQNRAIDPRRTAVRMATLDIQKADPELFQQILLTQYEAASTYWAWFAAAKQHRIALELMRLAEQRVDRMEKLIAAGDLAAVVGIDNRRLLALRRERLIEAQQKLDTTAIKLSLYYRDSLGRPVVPATPQQALDFPRLPGAEIDIDAEVTRAMTNRPELQILQISEEQVRAELRLAINQRLPEISFSSEVSQDVGGLASSKGDKQPFKLEAGLIGSVPVQRRKAIGKAQALRARLSQIDARRQLTSDRIANEVRQAATIYDAAISRLEQAQITRQLAQQTLAAGETSFSAGDIDLLLLNIYEQAFADAGIDIILAQADLLSAEAMLIIATGRSLLDPESNSRDGD